MREKYESLSLAVLKDLAKARDEGDFYSEKTGTDRADAGGGRQRVRQRKF